MKSLLLFLTFVSFCQFRAFDLQITRREFYAQEENKERNAELLRSYFLDEAPDSIFNLGKHLMEQGLLRENSSWLNFGKLLISSYYSKKGKTSYSITFLKDCIDYYTKTRNKQRLADAYNLLGQAYYLDGAYSIATGYLLKSIEQASLVPDEDEAFAAYLTLTENLIAQEKYKEAEKQVLIFVQKAKNLQLNKALRKGYGLLAKIYLNTDQKKKAIRYFHKTLSLAYQNGDKLGLSTAYNNQAIAYFELGEIDSAEIFFQKALKLRLEINYPKTICESYYNLATLYFYVHKEEMAVAYLMKMISIAQKSTLIDEEVDAYLKLVSFYEDQKDLKSALTYSKKLYLAQKKQLKKNYELQSWVDGKHKDLLKEERSYVQKIRERQLIERVENAENQNRYILLGMILFCASTIFLFWKINYSYKDKSVESAESEQ